VENVSGYHGGGGLDTGHEVFGSPGQTQDITPGGLKGREEPPADVAGGTRNEDSVVIFHFFQWARALDGLETWDPDNKFKLSLV